LYSAYSTWLGFSVEVTQYDRLTVGGSKSAKFASDTGISEASASVAGKGVFKALKYECGVHRVQRVPITGTGKECRWEHE